MIQEAEENAEADKAQKEKVEAKNTLESYLYNLKNAVTANIKEKLDPSEAEQLDSSINDALTWLEENPSEEKEAYDSKMEEVKGTVDPLLAKAYQASAGADGAGAGPGDSSDGGDSGPTVEEVD